MASARGDSNDLGQPIGHLLPGWQTRPLPPKLSLQGRFCRLEPLSAARHADSLFDANSLDAEGRNWTYLAVGPFPSREEYRDWVERVAPGPDPQFFAIVDLTLDRAVGVASFLRMDPANGVIEVGHLNFSPLLQRRCAATEAMFLMMQCAFQLGYRRYEWKCNALNQPSRTAAQRLGFTFEGVFRQAAVVKGRNRDTAWYSIIDAEWPALEAAFTQWLAPTNFDANGNQRVALSTLTADALSNRVKIDPVRSTKI